MKIMFLKIRWIILVLAICRCSDKGASNEGFYSKSRYDDVCRLPLINPYEALSYNGGHSWFYRLNDVTLFPREFSEIDSVGITDSVIVLYKKKCIAFKTKNGSVEMISQGNSPVWLLIDTRAKSEIFLGNKSSYDRSIDSLKLQQIKLFSIRQAFDSFDKNNVLPLGWPNESKK